MDNAQQENINVFKHQTQEQIAQAFNMIWIKILSYYESHSAK